MELPPRTRRIRYAWPHDGHGRGTTSAYAENTHLHYTLKEFLGNYLRVRGEYLPDPDWVPPATELPPRTRRIQRQALENLTSLGTTSAYAENTCYRGADRCDFRNYLRVRGEYVAVNFRSPASTELPPRTRRILRKAGNLMVCWGTTSAYAENTFWVAVVIWLARNYLRVRGEYPTYLRPAFLHAELPPRTRRILLHYHLCFSFKGTTSAYAENTNQGPGHGHRGGNYLRVRGEYRIKAERERKLAELPPRTRRIPVSGRNFFPLSGTTSAYAENTSGRRLRTRLTRNYLHVRGEYCLYQLVRIFFLELPPRTRRIQKHGCTPDNFRGTTSAYAENT